MTCNITRRKINWLIGFGNNIVFISENYFIVTVECTLIEA